MTVLSVSAMLLSSGFKGPTLGITLTTGPEQALVPLQPSHQTLALENGKNNLRGSFENTV